MSGDGEIAGVTFKFDSEDYHKLREEMLDILSKYNMSLEDFLKR